MCLLLINIIILLIFTDAAYKISPSGDNNVLLYCIMERGSSAIECRTRNRENPGSNPPLLPFRRFGIFVISTTHQFTQLWFRNEQVCQWVKCEAL